MKNKSVKKLIFEFIFEFLNFTIWKGIIYELGLLYQLNIFNLFENLDFPLSIKITKRDVNISKDKKNNCSFSYIDEKNNFKILCS